MSKNGFFAFQCDDLAGKSKWHVPKCSLLPIYIMPQTPGKLRTDENIFRVQANEVSPARSLVAPTGIQSTKSKKNKPIN